MIALFAFLLISPAASSAQPPDLAVLAATPSGPAQSPTPPDAIVATFNQPMVALSSPADMGNDCPLKLTPRVPGRCRWRGTQVLAFEPLEPLSTASAFRAEIPAGTRSAVTGRALAKAYSWSFETRRPQVVDSRPKDKNRWIAPGAVLFLHFDLPMDPRRARGSIALLETGGGEAEHPVPVGVRRATPAEIKEAWPWSYGENAPSTTTVLALKPAAPLGLDRSYRLVLKAGLAAADGSLGLPEERVIRFRSPSTLNVIEGPERAFMPRMYSLALSNPVRYRDLVANTRIEGSTLTWSGDDYNEEATGVPDEESGKVGFTFSDPGLVPDHDYALIISSGLRDVFGQTLGREVRLPFSNDEIRPSLTMPNAFGVLEQTLPARQPVVSVNVPTAQLRKAIIPDDKFIPFYQSIQWSGTESLPIDAPAKTWEIGLPRNRTLRTFVDLGPLFARAQPQRGGGLAAVEVTGPQYIEKAVLDVTRVGLNLRSSIDSTLVWATFLKDGAAATGVPVELRDDANKVLWRGKTDKDGIADAPGLLGLGIKDWDESKRPNLWAFAKDAKGTAVLSLDWHGELEPWRFDIPYDWNPRPASYAGSLFTERGVYRSGETVHVKALVRRLADGDWRRLGAGDPRVLEMRVVDARGAEVLKTTATLSDASSLDESFALPDAAPTGHWSVTLREPGGKDDVVRAVPAEGEGGGGDDESDESGDSAAARPASGKSRVNLSHTFRVEAFKPATFEVKAIPSTTSWLAGDVFDASIEGWYLFGAPMAGEKAEWSLRLEPSSYAPPGWPGFSFQPAWRKRTAEIGSLLDSGEAVLDKAGRAKASAVLDAGDAQGPLDAIFEASVTSPERQRLFGRASGVVHRANLYIGLKSDKSFVELGEPWSAEAVAVRPDGTRAPGISATWSLLRREWLSIQRAGVAGRLEWVSEQHETVVSTGEFAASPSTWTWTWTPDKPGEYELSVAGKDEQGRPAETVYDFLVAGAGDAWWKRSDTDLIELVPDQDSYKPGETARILVKSPYDRANALVTVEREGVLARWTQELKGGASVVRVPIGDRDVPNVFVSVSLVRGRSGKPEWGDEGVDLAKPQAKFGYKMLSVDTGARKLKVEVSSDKSEYRPGGELAASVRVTDADGKPAAAEVTLYAVDEGVLNLTSYQTPDVFSDFYGPRPLLVASADSRPLIIGQRSYGEKGKARGGGGGRGSPLPGVDLRQNFSPTAYWGPTLTTDADGRATASFKLPDSLTRFRLMAVVSDDKRFGSGQSRATVSKPLSLRPSLPRLARVGDSFEGGAVVHNFSKQDSTVTVALALEGTAVAVEGAASRQVFLAAGHSVETTWKCRATGIGKAEFRFAAKAGAETDGLAWTVPVSAPERLERSATSGAVADAPVVEALTRPTDAVAGVGGVEATFSPTALSGLREGARYLLQYPYGCLEQRMSRAMPVIVGAELVATFGLGDLSALKASAQKQLDLMPSYQHAAGGYGYWENPWRPDPWLTAYALETASLARREGYAVPEESLRKAALWLKKYLSEEKQDWAYPYAASSDYAARAYAVYALGLYGDPQPAYFRALYDRHDQLPYLGVAYLLKAAPSAAGEPEAKTLSDQLMSQAQIAPRTLHFQNPADQFDPWIHDSDARTTAVVLQAFLEARGGFAGDEKAARWLVEERKSRGRWRTTEENAESLRALQDFYRRYEKEEPNFTAALSREGEASALWTEKFAGRSLESRRKTLPLDAVFAGAPQARLAFAKEGIGRLYYDLVLSYAPASFAKPESEGFSVERTVKPLRAGALTAGKRAVVTLTVRTKQDRAFVALEDPLPAGWEIVDPTFAVEGEEDARALDEQSGRGQYWGTFSRSERYDDRIQVFADLLTAGEHRWSYLIQATTPGRYHVPSTYVEQMYEPEVFGRTASGEVEVAR
jgi:uncharacterized protein YfaS (alpha-2-macroglobulin family)